MQKTLRLLQTGVGNSLQSTCFIAILVIRLSCSVIILCCFSVIDWVVRSGGEHSDQGAFYCCGDSVHCHDDTKGTVYLRYF